LRFAFAFLLLILGINSWIMSSFFKKVKSLFFTEIKVDKSEVEKTLNINMEEDRKQTGQELKNEEERKDEQSKRVSGKPNNDFLAILITAMQEASREEATYLEFKQNLKSLRHLDFDDKTRYETAFAIASNQGVDKQKLLESASFFQRVLEKEGKKFESTLETQRTNRIAAKKLKIKNIRDQIFEKQNEIEKIKEEIRKLEEQIGNEKETMNENRNRIEQTATDFFNSLEFLKAKIIKDIDNFNKYL